jgi:hypothetical protein
MEGFPELLERGAFLGHDIPRAVEWHRNAAFVQRGLCRCDDIAVSADERDGGQDQNERCYTLHVYVPRGRSLHSSEFHNRTIGTAYPQSLAKAIIPATEKPSRKMREVERRSMNERTSFERRN